jgi:hypothetical protein
MRVPIPALAVLAALLVVPATPAFAARTLKVKVDGSKSDALKMLEQLNKHGQDKGLAFQMTEDGYEFRIATEAEGASGVDMMLGTGGADASAAVLTPSCELLFIVTRGGRMTSGGAMNAVSKELVKRFEKYLKITGGDR